MSEYSTYYNGERTHVYDLDKCIRAIQCRNADYDDETLLEKALELLDISREDLVKKVNEDKET